jgi:hypothetical protein
MRRLRSRQPTQLMSVGGLMSRFLAGFTIAIAAVLTTTFAAAECAPSGVAAKLKVPLLKSHSPCGYKGREAETSTVLGPVCSSAATGVKRCSRSNDPCASNSDCAQRGCLVSFDTAAPCDSHMDCLPCDNGGNCGITTCYPPFPLPDTCVAADFVYQTGYTFDESGGCTLSAKSKVLHDCSAVSDTNGSALGLPAGRCHVTFLSVRCKGVLDDGGLPVNGSDDEGFKLSLNTRITFDDGSTTLEIPLEFHFDHITQPGSLSLESNTAEALVSLFQNAAQGALPPCTTIEILGAQIFDGNGLSFASMGLATR